MIDEKLLIKGAKLKILKNGSVNNLSVGNIYEITSIEEIKEKIGSYPPGTLRYHYICNGNYDNFWQGCAMIKYDFFEIIYSPEMEYDIY